MATAATLSGAGDVIAQVLEISIMPSVESRPNDDDGRKGTPAAAAAATTTARPASAVDIGGRWTPEGEREGESGRDGRVPSLVSPRGLDGGERNSADGADGEYVVDDASGAIIGGDPTPGVQGQRYSPYRTFRVCCYGAIVGWTLHYWCAFVIVAGVPAQLISARCDPPFPLFALSLSLAGMALSTRWQFGWWDRTRFAEPCSRRRAMRR